MDINAILGQMGYTADAVSVFKSKEDDSEYAVWRVTIDGKDYVLKAAKADEFEIYTTFLSQANCSVPRLYQATSYQGKTFLLLEYIPGEDLCSCNRTKLMLALDALIALQERYWGHHEYDAVGHSFEKSIPGRITRGKYLEDATLEKAYEVYLQLYATLPRTLCHDDLLPFNLLISEKKAVLIDWEQAGILPYPTSLVRLIAHGENDPTAFFHMTDSDKDFAIQYYYDRLIKSKGIGYEAYREALDAFFLYEYCEWVMLGNRYNNRASERYQRYCILAKELAAKISKASV